MHDFLLAKEIVDEIKKIADDKDLKKIKSAKVEIGMIAMAHDGFDEHVEDVSIENLQFAIENISKGTVMEGAKIAINKVAGEHWKLVEIDGE